MVGGTGRNLEGNWTLSAGVGVKLSRLGKKTPQNCYRFFFSSFVSVSGFKKRKEKAKNIVQASEEVQFPSKGVNLQETTRPHRDWTAVGAGFRARKKASLCRNVVQKQPFFSPLCFIPCFLETKGDETTTKTTKKVNLMATVSTILYTHQVACSVSHTCGEQKVLMI